MVSGGTTASSDALTDAAVYNSATMAAMAPTAGTSFTGSPNATLSSVSPGTTVYSLSGADWEALSTLTFAGASTGAIINVGGTSLTKALNINLGSLLASDVIFNFYEATSLDFSGAVNFHGTILAPNANVKLAGVNLFGAVISDTFESPSANIQHRGYTGFLTPQSAVPEPATWAMMIMGFGLAAGALRRRKTAPGALAAA
jgi:choice-of-anchor A domain-containing protein